MNSMRYRRRDYNIAKKIIFLCIVLLVAGIAFFAGTHFPSVRGKNKNKETKVCEGTQNNSSVSSNSKNDRLSNLHDIRNQEAKVFQEAKSKDSNISNNQKQIAVPEIKVSDATMIAKPEGKGKEQDKDSKKTAVNEKPNSDANAVSAISPNNSNSSQKKAETKGTENALVKKEEGPAKANGNWIKIVKHEHKLYVMSEDNKPIKIYGVAVGKNKGNKQKSGDCRTPEGKDFSVQVVQDASSWSHDFHDGKGVIKHAYGPWFIRLKTGWNGIGIHGTHNPASIGTDATEGCIRLKNNDVAELKKKYIKRGMRVVIEQ